MKLLSLKLLHFRRFREEEIIFNDDFSLIFGKNGAGKSSILDAIGFALFGPGSKDFVRVNTENLKSHFLQDREPSKVELNFQIGLSEYKIIRIIDAGTKKFASVFIPQTKDTLIGPNGLEIIGGTEITNYISKLTGVTKDTFIRSVFARQKDLEVLSGPKEDRKNLINSILGLDKIENLITEIKKDIKEGKIYLDIVKKEVSEFDEESLKIEKTNKIKAIETIKTDLKSQEEWYNELQKSFQNTKTKYFEIVKKRDQNTSFLNNKTVLLKDLENIKNNIEQKNNELKEIFVKEKYLLENKEIVIKEAELKTKLDLFLTQKKDFEIKQKLQNEIVILQSDFEIVNREIEKNNPSLTLPLNLMEGNNSDFKNSFEILNKEIFSLDTKIKEVTVEKSKQEVNVENIRNNYKKLKQELDEINKLGTESTCPTCKRPLQEYLPTLINLYEKNLLTEEENGKKEKQKLLSILEVLQKLEQEFLLKNNELISLQNKEKEFIRLNEKLENISKNITEKKAFLEKLQNIEYDEKNHKECEKDYIESKTQLQKYLEIFGQVKQKQSIEEFIKIQTENNKNKEEELKSILENIKKLDYKEEEYLQITKDYETLNSKINQISIVIKDLDKQKTNLEFEINNIIQKEKNFIDDKKKIEEFVKNIDYKELKKDILSDYIIYLLQNLKPIIEDLASDYFAIITDNKYCSISLDDDYNILIDEKTIDLYSGGERDLANLCLRLSLGQNLTGNRGNPINFLILDEILGSQDKTRQENILKNLKKLEHKFSQIILISHLEDIKEMATNMIEVKQKDKDESEIVYW